MLSSRADWTRERDASGLGAPGDTDRELARPSAARGSSYSWKRGTGRHTRQ